MPLYTAPSAPSPTPAQIRTIFDQIAPVYDQLNWRLSFGQHRIWKAMTVKWAEPTPAALCLDVCCGSGDLAQMLAQKVGPRGQVFGLDFAPAQLAIAQQRVAGRNLPIQWVQGDALALPFADQTFDAITMGYGLRNVTDIPRCLQELHRVLKPNRRVAILDFHRPDHPWLRQFQQWYLDAVVVPAASHLGFHEAYAYIGPSLDRFPTGPEQVTLARAAGFDQVTHYAIAAGMMGVLVLTRTAAGELGGLTQPSQGNQLHLI